MLATSISGRDGFCGSRWAVTQSTPHTSHDTKPWPSLSSTLTDHSRTPGATPIDAEVVVERADDACHVRAVALVVVPLVAVAARAVVAADDVQVGMVAVDARVEDGHVGVDLHAARGQCRRPSSIARRRVGCRAGCARSGWRSCESVPPRPAVMSSSEICHIGDHRGDRRIGGHAPRSAQRSARAEKPPTAELYTSSMSPTPLRVAMSWMWRATRPGSTLRCRTPSESAPAAAATGCGWAAASCEE